MPGYVLNRQGKKTTQPTFSVFPLCMRLCCGLDLVRVVLCSGQGVQPSGESFSFSIGSVQYGPVSSSLLTITLDNLSQGQFYGNWLVTITVQAPQKDYSGENAAALDAVIQSFALTPR
jgi:hypothetical protein